METKVDMELMHVTEKAIFTGGYYVVVASGGTVMAAFSGHNAAKEYFKAFNPGSWRMGHVNF